MHTFFECLDFDIAYVRLNYLYEEIWLYIIIYLK